MGPEALLIIVKNAAMIVSGVKLIARSLGVGTSTPPKLADGTELTFDMIDAAFTAAAAPYQRIADRADAELAKLPAPPAG